jgi:putative membrane protein
MHRFLIKTFVTALAIFVVVNILPWIEVEGFLSLVVTAILLGVLNAILRPILIFLTLPITIVSFGLFIFVINGIILYLVSMLVPGFKILNIWAAILASILISIISGAINWLMSDATPGHRSI